MIWAAVPVAVLSSMVALLMIAGFMSVNLELDNQLVINQYIAVAAASVLLLTLFYILSFLLITLGSLSRHYLTELKSR